MMLANRSNRINATSENEAIINDAKTKGLSGVDKNIPPKTQRKGLGLRPANIPSSTITPALIPTNKPSLDKLILAQKNINNDPKYDEPLKRKINKVETDQLPKIDENDEVIYSKDSYNALLDICPFDEILYAKVKKLELADDGLPTFDSTEPFDF